MTKQSEITKRDRLLSWLFWLLSFLLNFGPLIAFSIYAFTQGEPRQKLVLGGTITVALVLTVLNALFKYHLRSVMWILVIGIYFCIQKIGPMLATVAICTMVDEFIVHPLYKSFRGKYKVNREIDKRFPGEADE